MPALAMETVGADLRRAVGDEGAVVGMLSRRCSSSIQQTLRALATILCSSRKNQT